MPITNRPRTTPRPATPRGRTSTTGGSSSSSTSATSRTQATRETVDAVDAIDELDGFAGTSPAPHAVGRVLSSPLGPAPTPIPDAERKALLDGSHVDPHKLLGAKTVTVDADKGRS